MKKQTTNRDSLEILAAGKGWLAVDKPAGISVHNDPGKDLCALSTDRLRTDADLKGITGLTVAIGSVVTLAVLMRITAGVDWSTVFAKKPGKGTPPPLQPVAAASMPGVD